MWKAGTPGPPMPPQPEMPPADRLPMVEYEVLTEKGWEKIVAHQLQFDNGCLILSRLVNADEACTMTRIVPAGVFAPGEWRRCKTDYAGYQKNPFTIH